MSSTSPYSAFNDDYDDPLNNGVGGNDHAAMRHLSDATTKAPTTTTTLAAQSAAAATTTTTTCTTGTSSGTTCTVIAVSTSGITATLTSPTVGPHPHAQDPQPLHLPEPPPPQQQQQQPENQQPLLPQQPPPLAPPPGQSQSQEPQSQPDEQQPLSASQQEQQQQQQREQDVTPVASISETTPESMPHLWDSNDDNESPATTVDSTLSDRDNNDDDGVCVGTAAAAAAKYQNMTTAILSPSFSFSSDSFGGGGGEGNNHHMIAPDNMHYKQINNHDNINQQQHHHPSYSSYYDYKILRNSRSCLGGVNNRVPGIHQHAWKMFCPHKIILPRTLRQTAFQRGLALVAVISFCVVGIVTTSYSQTHTPHYRIAMIGNSMMYYNDFPRFLEAISDHTIEQDSCLHGDATLHSILISGSGTYKIWRTGVAQIRNASVELYGNGDDDNSSDEEDEDQVYNKQFDFSHLYDYGACTVPQLLFGFDKTLDQKMDGWSFDQSYESHGDDYFDDDDYYTLDNDDEILSYDFDSFFDGTNPCLMDPHYYKYRNYLYWGADYDANNDNNRYNLFPTAPRWDFIILNDNTRSPAQAQSRQDALSILEQQYLLWFQETGSTPILMFTYAYDTPYRDMQGVLDIPTFTSLTYEGYRQYAELLAQRLPEDQQPKIAPVGLAFLTVWEEAYDFWNRKMFHIDRIHASPHGSYLQGCVVYCTIYGKLPPRKTAIQQLESLWNDARRMQPVRHRRLPLPTREEATYLYHVAERVCLQGHIPKSFVFYENGESTNYIPTDDLYKTDDIY